MSDSKSILILTALLIAPLFARTQQIPDSTFIYEIAAPAFVENGPVVAIDAAHHNFHTAENRYFAFARLLQLDGYNVKANHSLFVNTALDEIDILVISNALHSRNIDDWFLPTPSAFTEEEITTLTGWVEKGGALFLIADHMPFPGAASELALQFGFIFSNGFARDTTSEGGPVIFNKLNGGLIENQFSRNITSIATFTGQGFKAPQSAQPILQFDDRFISFEPDTAWVFAENTRRVPLEGWVQLAALQFGKGRVVVSGEAAMFSAQLAGHNRLSMGMGHSLAAENPKLLLNIMHWLTINQ